MRTLGGGRPGGVGQQAVLAHLQQHTGTGVQGCEVTVLAGKARNPTWGPPWGA